MSTTHDNASKEVRDTHGRHHRQLWQEPEQEFLPVILNKHSTMNRPPTNHHRTRRSRRPTHPAGIALHHQAEDTGAALRAAPASRHAASRPTARHHHLFPLPLCQHHHAADQRLQKPRRAPPAANPQAAAAPNSPALEADTGTRSAAGGRLHRPRHSRLLLKPQRGAGRRLATGHHRRTTAPRGRRAPPARRSSTPPTADPGPLPRRPSSATCAAAQLEGPRHP